jgi:hypothetical protein
MTNTMGNSTVKYIYKERWSVLVHCSLDYLLFFFWETYTLMEYFAM